MSSHIRDDGAVVIGGQGNPVPEIACKPGTLEERARAIYAQFIIDNTPGAGPDDVPRFDDNAHGVRIALAALTEAADEIASLRARVEVMDSFVKRVALDPKWTLAASEVLMRPPGDAP